MRRKKSQTTISLIVGNCNNAVGYCKANKLMLPRNIKCLCNMKENVHRLQNSLSPFCLNCIFQLNFMFILYFGKMYIEITVAIFNGNLSDASYPL